MSIGTIPPLSQWKRWVPPTPPVMAAWGILLLAFVWTYWTAITYVVHTWATTPDYGHGFVVPLFAAFLLWYRQEMVDPWPNKGSLWCIPFFVAFAVLHCAIVYLRMDRVADSMFPFLLGMALALGGWKAFRWAWPSIVFLIFMVPLPDRFAKAMGIYLQRGATIITVYVLQTVGIPAITQGVGSNEIHLSSPPPLEVAQACSGLRMMTVFYAMCVGACFVLRIPVWKKIVLVVSAAPIAVISNVFRISLTGMLQEWISPSVAHVFHDYFGYLEVIPALLLIGGELALLSALLIEAPEEGPLVFAEGVAISRRRNVPAGMEGMVRSSGMGPPRDPRAGAPPQRPRQM